MRTTIVARSNHRVFIRFEHPNYHDKIVELEIWAPTTGGFVFYETPHGDKQLCQRLALSGVTLYWNGKHPLVDLVRREYKAMQNAARREARRYASQHKTPLYR